MYIPHLEAMSLLSVFLYAFALGLGWSLGCWIVRRLLG